MSMEEIKPPDEELQVTVFRLRGIEFGIDINQVHEIVRMVDITHIPEAPGFIEGVINLRGKVIAVIDMARQFKLPPQEEVPKTARIVIVEAQGQTIGLIVDEVPEVLRINRNDIEPTPEVFQTEIKKDQVKGVGKIGTRLLILLDLEKVLEYQEIAEAQSISEEKQEKLASSVEA